MCNEDSDHHHLLRGGGNGGVALPGVRESECDHCVRNNSNDRISNNGINYYNHRTICNRSRCFRLRSSLVLLIALVTALCLLPHPSLCLDSSSVEENASVLISQSEVKTIEPTNNPTKVFIRRRIFRKLQVKDPSATNSTSNEEAPSTTTTQPPSTQQQALFSLAKRLQNNPNKKQFSSTVTGNSLKSSMQSSQSLIAAKQKFNFQSLKTRLGLAAPTPEISEETPSSTPTTPTNASSNMVMIPLPPSQRKAYTPVIMQVSKSTTSKPETKVQTFKLNKMFVPIGIYGKVVENGTETTSTIPTTEPASPSSSTPIPSIRHRGTDTVGEPKRERKVKGIADSVDLTYRKPDLKSVSLTTERPDIGSISITTEANDLFSSVFGSSERVNGNGVRRGDQHNRYGGNKKPFSSNSGLTLMTPPALGQHSDAPSTLADSLASYGTYASYSSNYNKNKYSPSSIVGSITDSMSKIPSLVPSLFHKGLTSLASMTSSMKEDPFVDENFSEAHANSHHKKNRPLISAPSSYTPKIPASVPGGYISGLGGGNNGGNGGGGYGGSRDQTYAGSELSSTGGGNNGGNKKNGGLSSSDLVEYETLEYFRKRPHLLAQLQQQQKRNGGGGASSWMRRSQGVRFSKGFKPVNAPEHLAREYYKSTSTTVPTPEEELLLKAYQNIRRAKKMGRGSWLLRNSNEYVANKNDKLVRMWRNLFDSFSDDRPSSPQPKQPKAEDRMDKTDNTKNKNEDPKASSTLQARRSSPQSPQKPKNPILNAQWSNIKSKYSKDQIDEAKERILTLLNSGYGDEALLEDGPPGLEDEDELQHVVEYDTHMPPPPPHSHHHHDHHDHHDHHHAHGPHAHPIKTLSLTKGLSGAAAGAFKDLVKFFKLGISVGTGQSREPVNYEQVVDEQEEQELGGGDWKPVVRRPLISFSAGISLKNPLSSKPHHHHDHHDHHHEHGPPHHSPHHHHYEEVDLPPSSSSTHYSSSSSPYIPQSYKGLNHYIDELASTSSTSHLDPPTSPSYSSGYGQAGAEGAPEADYAADDIVTEDVGGGEEEYGASKVNHAYAVNPLASTRSQQQKYRDSEAEYSYDAYRTLKPSPSRRPHSNHAHLDQDDSNTDWAPVRQGGSSPSASSLNNVVYNPGLGSSSEYELVPSSVYLNGGHDPRDIAAVVKPQGVSDDMVRSVLPAGLRGLRILDYPSEYASLNSISQALGKDEGGSGASGGSRVSFKSAMKKLRENYVAKENAYLPVGDDGSDIVGTLGGAGGLGAYYGSAGGSISSSPISNYYNQQQQLLLQQHLLQQQQLQQQQGIYGSIGGLDIVGTGNVFAHANRINNNHYGRGSVSASPYAGGAVDEQQQNGKDSLGFTSNYNLPQNLDPDIAAILKSELDKDDIPEDVRQEFLEAKREEQKKKQQQTTAYQNNRRVDVAQQTLIDSLLSSAARSSTPKPPTTAATPRQHQYVPYAQQQQRQQPQQQQMQQQPTHPSMQSRAYHQQPPYSNSQFNSHRPPPPPPFSNNGPRGPPPRGPPPPFHGQQQQQPLVTTRFFAPIPITPTLMTTAMKNPRYSSPVPRYVIELAKKLQTDKSVQGIVRVSAKRGRGLPPIEYLYPVKG